MALILNDSARYLIIVTFLCNSCEYHVILYDSCLLLHIAIEIERQETSRLMQPNQFNQRTFVDVHLAPHNLTPVRNSNG